MRNLASCGILAALLVGCQKSPEAVKPVPGSPSPVVQLDPRSQVFTPPIHESVPVQRTTTPQQDLQRAPPFYKQVVGSWQRKDNPRERVSIENGGAITLTTSVGERTTIDLEFTGTLSQGTAPCAADLRITQGSVTALEAALTEPTIAQNAYPTAEPRPDTSAAVQRVRQLSFQRPHIELSLDSSSGDLIIQGDGAHIDTQGSSPQDLEGRATNVALAPTTIRRDERRDAGSASARISASSSR